jgi:hypothetical protein
VENTSPSPDIAEFFISIPPHMLPALDEAWRRDLVDLYRAGKEARLQNLLKGFSHLQTLTSDYLLLQTTATATFELKILPFADTATILCLVTTVSAPAPDSHIAFFTSDWEPLDTSLFFSPPTLPDFLLPPPTPPVDLLAYLDILLVHYRLSPDAPSLTATYTTPLYLDEPRRTALTPFLASPRTYIWDGTHFR